MRAIGTIARLQVQRSSLKVGLPGQRAYDPSPLRAVPALSLSEDGVIGWAEDGTPLDDVHRRDHPSGKNRSGRNGISIMFSGHYDAMRGRFGQHLTDGIAGESILIHAGELLQADDLLGGIAIETDTGELLHLEHAIIAEPCVEFTRFALGYPSERRPDDRLADALTFLRGGMRGFYITRQGGPATVHLGDRVYLLPG